MGYTLLPKRMTPREWQERFREGELEKYEVTHTFMHGTTLDKVFDVLSFGSYLSGGYAIEKNKRLDEVREKYAADPERQELAEAKIKLEFANPWMAGTQAMSDPQLMRSVLYSIEHRVEPSRVYDDRFAAGLARNIVSDPTTFVTGVGGVVRHGARRLFKGVARAIPSQKLRGAAQGARDIIGEAFTPGYKLKQLGPRMSEFYDDYMNMVASRRGAKTQAFWEVQQLGKQYKRVGASAMEYVERGVSTGIGGLDKYLDDVVKPYISDIRAAETVAGYDIGEIVNYVPHVFGKRGQELLNKLGSEDAVIKYFRDKAGVAYGKERTLAGSAREVNELLGDKVFVEDLWEALATRAQRSASDIATTTWLNKVQAKFGIQETDTVVKEVATQAGKRAIEKAHKFEVFLWELDTVRRNIAEGVSTRINLTGAVDKARRSGVFNIASLRGQSEVYQWLGADVATLTERTAHHTRIFAAGEELIDKSIKSLDKELFGRFQISRTQVEDTYKLYVDEVSSQYGTYNALQRALGALQGKLGNIDYAIAPIREHITELRGKADATKTVRVLQDAVSVADEYVMSKRPDITRKLPSKMVAFLDEMDEIKYDDSILARVGTAAKGGMQFWKKSVTIGIGPLIRSAFFGRNIFTGMMQNVQQVGAFRTARGVFDAARLAAGKGTFETLEHGKVNAATIQRMMRESGQMSSTGMSDIAMSEQLFPSTFGRLWNAGQRLMKWSEATVREPLFLERIRSMPIGKTAEEVKRAHFDYSPEALTAFESTLKAYGFPFYTFTRFNLERQIGKVFTDPRGYKELGMIQREAVRAAGKEEEYERRPEWQRDMYMLPIGEQLVHFPVPHEAVSLKPSSIYYQLHPAKQLLDIMSTWADWGTRGFKVDKTRYILRNLVFGSQRRQMKQLTDTETSMKQKLAEATGFSVYDVAPETVSVEEFEAYRYRIMRPTKEQEYRAWAEAGRPRGFRVMQLGEARGGIGVAADTVVKAEHWWQKDKIVKAKEIEFDLAVVSQDIYVLGRGFDPSEQQLKYLTQLQGAQRSAALTGMIRAWSRWQMAQARVEPATKEQRMAAWVRAGRPDDATDRVYRNAAGGVVGVASFTSDEIEEITEYIGRGIQLTDAAYEWAFIQSDMKPKKWILTELRKKNSQYLSMQTAKEELKGFDVDQPVDADKIGTTQQFEYSAYRRGRVDYEQELIAKALGRGEIR
jgi:hypothetical protein